MMLATMTDRVWAALVALRDGVDPLTLRDWSEGEAAAWALYAPVARRSGRRFLLAQIGQSLDGRVATLSGDARDISGPDGLAHLHRCRALVDGVVIGVRTALHDSPRLTVRLARGPNPARVVIDPQGRLPDDAKVLREDGTRRIVVQSVDRPRAKGVEVLRLDRAEGADGARLRWISPTAIAEGLEGLGLRHLLIEGGGITISGFLEAGLLDRLHLGIAPLIIGAGPMSLTTPNPIDKLSDAVRPDTRSYTLGTDLLVDCDLGGTRGNRAAAVAASEKPSVTQAPYPATARRA
jgi:riboflavin-specific deaminase-like protein